MLQQKEFRTKHFNKIFNFPTVSEEMILQQKKMLPTFSFHSNYFWGNDFATNRIAAKKFFDSKIFLPNGLKEMILQQNKMFETFLWKHFLVEFFDPITFLVEKYFGRIVFSKLFCRKFFDRKNFKLEKFFWLYFFLSEKSSRRKMFWLIIL